MKRTWIKTEYPLVFRRNNSVLMKQGPTPNAMRILVLAQKGDWTACESALKALERSVVENLLSEGARQPLARISDTVRPFKNCKFG